MRKIDHHHCSGVPCDICGPDPRDAEIAALKAEVERHLRCTSSYPEKQAACARKDAEIARLKGEIAALKARAEKAEAERDAALAANAEMRAALDLLCRAVRVGEAHGFPEELHAGIVDEAIRGEAALSRTDLDADKVVVERKVVGSIVDGCDLLTNDIRTDPDFAPLRASINRLDALIKKGGG